MGRKALNKEESVGALVHMIWSTEAHTLIKQADINCLGQIQVHEYLKQAQMCAEGCEGGHLQVSFHTMCNNARNHVFTNVLT